MAEQQTEEVEETETEENTDGKRDILSLTDVFEESEEEAKAETEDDKGETEDKTTDETTKVEAKPDETDKAKTKEPAKAEGESPSPESIGLQAALVAERQKRQAAEEKLKSLEEPEKIPDPIEDPEGYSRHIKETSTKGLTQTKIDLSRSMMLSVKEDYPEKEKVFMSLIGRFEDGKLVITNEILHRQFLDSDNPGLFAYDHAVDHLLAEKYKDPDFEKNLEERLTKKILAGLEAKPNEGMSAADVPDLTSATATGSNTEKVEKVKELDDMFSED